MLLRWVEMNALCAKINACGLIGLVETVVTRIGGGEWLDGELCKVVKGLSQEGVNSRFRGWQAVGSDELKWCAEKRIGSEALDSADCCARLNGLAV